MTILHAENLSISYGLKPLLDNASLRLEKGERVCLIGRNGEGKSTLLKILAGKVQATDGKVQVADGIHVTYLEQDVDVSCGRTVFDEVTAGLGDLSQLLQRYHQLTHELGASEQADTSRLEHVQHELEARDGWQVNHRVEAILSQMELNADDLLENLSGGRLRRTALARVLVSQPDLLLLDEPTNHLDIESIQWLEKVLLDYQGAILFITHDRQLLRRLATRILELDRGILTSWPGDYQNYLRRVEERENSEQLANRRFDKKLAQEEVWIRQGIKARRTRNEGRVRALISLREDRKARRGKQGNVKLSIDSGEQSGKVVIEAKRLGFSWNPDKVVVDQFGLKVMRGDRIALVGPNGCGKSTLIRLLLKQLEPQQGSVRHGTKLEIAYFDQLRSQLDPDKSVAGNVAEGDDYVDVGGRRRHVISYLGDFLFSSERINTPVKALSGGECNRLLLAKLFTRPANLLVMDEPTNDLDIETLELLEELLASFDGTLLLVSHDREFIDNCVTSCLVIEGEGKITEIIGGYQEVEQYQERQQQHRKSLQREQLQNTEALSESKPSKASSKKLGYMEKRELEALPEKMEMLEAEIEKLQAMTNDPGFYSKDRDEITARLAELEEKQNEMECLFERWEELEAKS